jgi:protein O-GlcNAc transferase
VVGSFLKRLFKPERAAPTASLKPIDEVGKLKSANAAIAVQDFSTAVVYCTELVNAQSQNPDVYVSYGYALLNLGQFADAKTILTTAAKLAPNSADAFYMLGNACVELQEPDAAEQAWTRCYALSQEIEALYCDFCLLLFSRGKLAQAIDLMKTGLVRYPLNADIHFFLGNLHAEKADYAEAVIAYKNALRLNPESAILLSNYANALRQTGDLTLSNELAKRASQMAPESASILSNYLLGIQYSPLLTKADKFAAHLEYAQKFETPVLKHWGNYKNSLASGRKIRIGYISGDFRNHSLIFFITPILTTSRNLRCMATTPTH